jgi:hypothetical protein
MYEASGFVAVTFASSAFSAAGPAAVIRSSCKPSVLCNDGRGAAAVHGIYNSRDEGCARLCLGTRPTLDADAPTARGATRSAQGTAT